MGITLIGIDLETSGLPEADPEYRDNLDFSKICILRIGGWYQQEGDEPQVFDQIVRPCPGCQIDEKALEVHGLTAERLFDGANIQDAMNSFDRWLGDAIEKAHGKIVGHNLLRFDVPLLRVWTRNNRCPFVDDCACVDTLAIWKAWACKLRREATEQVMEFQQRAARHKSDARCSMDHVLQTLFGKDMVRSGPHSPVEDACLSVRIFEEMQKRGIVDVVLNRNPEGEKA